MVPQLFYPLLQGGDEVLHRFVAASVHGLVDPPTRSGGRLLLLLLRLEDAHSEVFNFCLKRNLAVLQGLPSYSFKQAIFAKQDHAKKRVKNRKKG